MSNPDDYPVLEWEDIPEERVRMLRSERKNGKIRWLYDVPGRGEGWTPWVPMTQP
jgi:hypothetical protein